MSKSSNKKKDDVSVVICGEAGHGIQTVEQILTRVLKLSGYNIFGTKEYMSRVRGGSNSTQIRVSSRRVSSPVDRIDILIPFDRKSLEHVKWRVTQETIILGEKEELAGEGDDDLTFMNIPFSAIASEIGAVYLNTVATGVVTALFNINLGEFENYIKKFFSDDGETIIRKNRDAAKRGYEIGMNLIDSGGININIKKSSGTAGEILINGAEAVGIGAIAGGCNFISSYPMSPSTAVLVFLADHSEEFGIVVEQAEDEIGAINMALGAWYAGGRALVTTSGGGFALMEEAVGLAGMIESPAVIHLAQRPGPATGLPTRTEQGDLQLALYSGHGEFPRILFAPGSIEDAVYLSHMAFNLADKYQIPVFILTDQYFMDAYYNLPTVNISETGAVNHIVKTEEDYKRYVLTENGISPRGIPGFGRGLVSVDSDEHDEEGHITEDLVLRVRMVNKRLAKLQEMKKELVDPTLVGEGDYDILVVCWGSTFNVVNEALTNLKRTDVSLLHYKQVYPLHPKTMNYLKKAKKAIIVEGNAGAQFANLIKRETGFEIQDKVLKYNGLQFSVEELVERLTEVI